VSRPPTITTSNRARLPFERRTVLFLCTGNYNRSRFAELLFNHVAAAKGDSWRAESRGLHPDPLNPGPISRHTLRALQRLGIALDTDMRFPIRVAEQDLLSCHHMVAVKEAEHRPFLEQCFPAFIQRVEFWYVHDLDCAGPDEAISQLERLVAELAKRLAAGRSRAES
jgi:low molecular weight protein-tyrosine phosphatase